ncbi:hypothetical protein TNCV_1853581 [Trichonephila clavipes]|nr:hypothetical protein TNCV_1853581 [Trichonephila clavipes]
MSDLNFHSSWCGVKALEVKSTSSDIVLIRDLLRFHETLDPYAKVGPGHLRKCRPHILKVRIAYVTQKQALVPYTNVGCTYDP